MLAVIISIFTVIVFFILLLTGVPFVKTPKKVLEKIFDEVKIKQADKVYDLGCGDASFLMEAEKKFGCQTVGFELSPWAYFLAKLSVFLYHSKAKVFYKNFYKENLADADVIFCFLLDSVMPKVQKLLEKQLKKGARVISFAFPIREWQPTKVIDPSTDRKKYSKIYIYQR